MGRKYALTDDLTDTYKAMPRPTTGAINNTAMDRKEEKIIARFKSALAEGDLPTIRYMLAFTERFEQMAQNINTYEQYLACGFTDKPSFDRYGWIDNDRALKDKTESVMIFQEDRIGLTVELCQLPNGNWVSGIQLTLSESGSYGGTSIWNKQYTDRQSAYIAALKTALADVQHSSCKGDMKYIKIIRQEMAAALQPCLF